MSKAVKYSTIPILFFLLIILSLIGCTNDSASNGQAEPRNEPSYQQDQTISDQAPPSDEPEPDKDPAPPSANIRTGNMTVHFIDVGQGDAILIQTPEQTILVDGGDRGNTVVNYLKNLNINSLDLVIGTHPHADHIGGLINVMQSIPVKEVIDPAVVHTTKTFEDYLTLIDEKDIIFTEGRAGMSRDLGGGANMEIFHPSSPSSNHLNDASIVAKVTFGEISFMLAGDAEGAAENQIRNSGGNLESTVLKIGHHGSRTSTTSSFLSAVSPDVAVIMLGRNSYGHPHDETLAKLDQADVKMYRTDVHGTIVITTDGQRYGVNIKEAYQYVPLKEREPAASQERDSSGEYVGSVNSDKYHYPDCRHAQNILPKNEIWFSSINDARDAKYVPCGGCNPPGG